MSEQGKLLGSTPARYRLRALVKTLLDQLEQYETTKYLSNDEGEIEQAREVRDNNLKDLWWQMVECLEEILAE